jgi:hypothetical protein
MIEFKFGKSNAFCREVMAHLITKDSTEPISNIDEEVDKWFDWFNSPESGSFNGDVLTTARYLRWTNTFFIDKGCNKAAVGECMKELCQSFGRRADDAYKKYEDVDDFFGGRYLTVYDYDRFRALCNQKFIGLQMFSDKDVTVDESHAIRALELFDEKFEWLAPYGFHPNWKVEFCVMVSVLQDIITMIKLMNGTFETDPLATEYQMKAQAFLDKYLRFEQQPNKIKFLQFLD